MSGQFVISLDFELLWGVRDHADRTSYSNNVLGAREAVPQMLEVFAQNSIYATWATVGFLFCETRDELIEMSPPEDLRPRYNNPALSNYSYFPEVGRNEAEDPFLQQFDADGNFIESREEENHTSDPALEIRYTFKDKDV